MSRLYLNGQQISSGYTITIYKYEPFSYLFSPQTTGGGDGYLRLMSASTLISALVGPVPDVPALTNIAIQFQSPGYRDWDPQTQGYTGATSTTEQIVIGWGPTVYTDGNVLVTELYTINVVIRAGRFIVPTLTNPSYTLYVDETISNTYGENIRFQAPGNLTVTAPFTTPALPPGISFVPLGTSPNLYWDLAGSPLAQIPATSYTVYARGGTNTSAVISKTISIRIDGPRIVISNSPSSNISLTVGTPITNTTLTARYANQFTSNLSYAWSYLPDGLQFVDISSNVISSPFRPADTNSTMILTGTPTETAAQYFRALGVSNVITNVVATRQTTPNITATQPISLTFGETVLFDSVSVPTLYRNSPIDASSIVFRASTYFPFSAGVTSIVAPSLPPGLSLSHTPGDSNAYLTGTPTAGVSASYNITATNSNGKTRTLSVPINVVDDVITIVGPTDTCYNFVISRPLSMSLTGYYPSNISYVATSSSGGNVNISISGISGLGITTTTVGSTLTLNGIPDTLASLTTATIFGSNPATGATGSYTFNYAVLTDDVSITSPLTRMTFFQNQEITPVQFSATTLSERPIVNWTAPSLPDGLLLSSTGRLTGTPTSNSGNVDDSFNVVASTGYVSETNSFNYRTYADDILITLVNDPTIVSKQFSNVELRAVTYSGYTTDISMGFVYPPQDPSPTFNVSNNVLSGDLTTSPGVLPYYEFNLDASYGLLAATQVFRMTMKNPATRRRFYIDASATTGFIPAPNQAYPKGVMTLYQDDAGNNYPAPAFVWSSVFTTGNINYGNMGDLAQSSNMCVLVSGSRMYRCSNGGSWSLIPNSDISEISGIVGGYQVFPPAGLLTISGPILTSVASDGNSNWLAIGVGYDSNLAGAQRTIIRTSSNDGATWRDVSLVGFSTSIDSNSRLFYNNGRYFLTQSNATDPVLRADISDLTNWTGSSGGMPTFTGNIATSLAFSGNVALCGGSGGGLYRSTNNGETWTSLAPFANTVVSISKVSSNWLVIDQSNANYSSNGTTFSTILNSSGAEFVGSDWDGGGFQLYSTNTFFAGVKLFYARNIAYDGTIGQEQVAGPAPGQLKRTLTHYIDNGPSTGILTLGGDASLSFTQPATNDYTFLQFTGVNLQFEASSPSNEFVYYYASDLPQGTRLVLDASGISADVSGIATQYNSLPSRSYVFARQPIAGYVAQFPFTARVVSPFVLKQQSSAAGYTAYLRQYVEVNGAQNARDSVALPVQEYPIGKFTSPGVGDVVTDSNCPC